MLSKHINIDIPATNPFVNDKLDRIKIANNLTRLVQSTNQPFVISIEAPWGWGKTTFINMWKTQLESLGHTCLYFNAWENDFVEDPLIAFIGEISKAMDEKKIKGKAGKHLKNLKNIGGKLARRVIPLTIQIATQGLINQETVKKTSDILFQSGDEIANLASEIAEEKIKQYEADKNGMVEFRKELAEFAASLAQGENKKTPLVFFIDELDRCRPDFSVALLERIKHLFSVEGVVFILGIDRNQIEQSVKSIYGLEMNTSGYLRRFIDFGIQLPQPSTADYCKFMYEYFHLREVFEKHNNSQEMTGLFMRVFVHIANLYKFSPRIIAQCFTEMNMVLRAKPSSLELHAELVGFLSSIKVANPNIFSLFNRELNHPDIQKIMKIVRDEIIPHTSDVHWLVPELELILLRGYLSDNDFSSVVQSIRGIANDGSHADHDHNNRMVELLGNPYNRYATRSFKNTIITMNLVEDVI